MTERDETNIAKDGPLDATDGMIAEGHKIVRAPEAPALDSRLLAAVFAAMESATQVEMADATYIDFVDWHNKPDGPFTRCIPRACCVPTPRRWQATDTCCSTTAIRQAHRGYTA